MSIYIASRIVKLMLSRGLQPLKARVLVLGLTFKENCPDVRNTKVFDIVKELKSYGAIVDVHDPWVDPAEAKAEYSIELAIDPERNFYDAVVVAVAHRQFRDMGIEGIRAFGNASSVVYDIKYLLPGDQADDRL
jgi:UDP-N-acetyl-D-galactosamine dehydrogenase